MFCAPYVIIEGKATTYDGLWTSLLQHIPSSLGAFWQRLTASLASEIEVM